ncbi:MAG: histidine phosphatase family protein [Parachlamydiaceae bacterium]|nr:histidine phosphatase family protein [Parachlamydiaceae bacterium]
MSHSANQTPITFYIVRHGETEWNVIRRIQGHIDIPLNDTGRLQAMNFATRFQNFYFTSCYSSGLMRACDTAKIILNEKIPKIEIYLDRRLRIRLFGNWEGKRLNLSFSLMGFARISYIKLS